MGLLWGIIALTAVVFLGLETVVIFIIVSLMLRNFKEK